MHNPCNTLSAPVPVAAAAKAVDSASSARALHSLGDAGPSAVQSSPVLNSDPVAVAAKAVDSRRLLLPLLFSLFTLHFSLLTSLAQDTDLRWDVDTARNTSVPLEIRRGESLTLTPRFLSYGVATNIASNATVALWYRSSDMSNGLYYAITGNVHSAAGGQARVRWLTTSAASATNYTYDFVLSTGSVVNLRAFGTIKLLSGVYSQATTLTNPPTAWGLLDWSSISNINLSSAPFPTSQTAVASYATISGQPADSTALVAYVASQVSGISGGTATQIVAGIMQTGAVASATWTPTAATATTLVGVATANITTNNASTIDSGTLADARIAATIARDSEVDAHTQNVTTAHNVDARIAASTQTIAGATVNGTVPAATWAAWAAIATNLSDGVTTADLFSDEVSDTYTNIFRVYSASSPTRYVALDAAALTTRFRYSSAAYWDFGLSTPNAPGTAALRYTGNVYEYLFGNNGNVHTSGHVYALSDTNAVIAAMAPVIATNVAANSLQLGGIAAASYVTGGVFSVGTAVSNISGTLYIPTNTFGGGTGGGSNQTPLTNNVNAAGYSITNLLGLVSTAAVGQVAFRMPFGTYMEWGDGTATNVVRCTAISAGVVHWISYSNSATAVTNIMQVNP